MQCTTPALLPPGHWQELHWIEEGRRTEEQRRKRPATSPSTPMAYSKRGNFKADSIGTPRLQKAPCVLRAVALGVQLSLSLFYRAFPNFRVNLGGCTTKVYFLPRKAHYGRIVQIPRRYVPWELLLRALKLPFIKLMFNGATPPVARGYFTYYPNLPFCRCRHRQVFRRFRCGKLLHWAPYKPQWRLYSCPRAYEIFCMPIDSPLELPLTALGTKNCALSEGYIHPRCLIGPMVDSDLLPSSHAAKFYLQPTWLANMAIFAPKMSQTATPHFHIRRRTCRALPNHGLSTSFTLICTFLTLLPSTF